MSVASSDPGGEGAATLSLVASAIVSSAIDCIVVIDESGRVVEFNPAAERTFGYERDAVMGLSIAELIVPAHLRAAHEAGMERFMQTGHATVLGRRVEIEAMHASGRLLPVELAITEVRLPDRRLFTAHIRDLTEARHAQAEILRQREALHQSEKMAALGSLLAGVAHELNNPLSIVVGQALMMREGAAAPDLREQDLRKLAERSARIEAAAERCARIVRTFLAMARQRPGARQAVDVAALVDGAVDLLAYGLRTAGIELSTHVEPDLPTIWADGDQLHQVLVNLLINARQALEERRGPRRVTLSAMRDREREGVVFAVSDNGPGVAEDIRGRIFDPFFTTKPQGVGTGVGLAVSRGMVEAQGGTLTLAPPEDGRGATFVVRVPLQATGAGEPTPASGDETAPAVQAARPRRLALVVDDEEEIAGLLSEILERRGYDTHLAHSGSAAQALIEGGHHYHVILCDIRMPQGDGASLYGWLEQARPDLVPRIGFVTGDTLGPAAGRFLARTGCPVIEKPFSPDDVERLVDALIRP